MMNSKTHKEDNAIPFLQLTRYLLANHPFFAQLLAALKKENISDLKCAFALSWSKGKPVLLYQQGLLNELIKDENRAVKQILHELLHLLLAHYHLLENKENSQLYNLAADIQVWSWLSSMLDKTPDYLQPFYPIFEQSKRVDAEAIISLLSDNKRYEQAALMVDPSHFTSHEYWLNNTSDNFLTSWQLWWCQLRQSLPLDLLGNKLKLQLELQSSPRKSVIPWRLMLRRFANNASRTYNKNSLRRPSKRYGTIPGVVRKRSQKILAIIDTSGSVDETMIQAFFNEIQELYRQGAQITLLQADNRIQETMKYKGKMPKWIWGRGATAFDPALEYANENGAFDGVLYFTDGQGLKPTIVCQYPLLWVLVGNEELGKINDWQGQMIVV